MPTELPPPEPKFDVRTATYNMLTKMQALNGIEQGKFVSAAEAKHFVSAGEAKHLDLSQIKNTPLFQEFEKRKMQITDAHTEHWNENKYDKTIPLLIDESSRLQRQRDSLNEQLKNSSSFDAQALQGRILEIDNDLKTINQIRQHAPTLDAPTPAPTISEITQKLTPAEMNGGFNGQRENLGVTTSPLPELTSFPELMHSDPELAKLILDPEIGLNSRIWAGIPKDKGLTANEYKELEKVILSQMVEEYLLKKKVLSQRA